MACSPGGESGILMCIICAVHQHLYQKGMSQKADRYIYVLVII
jgi:hypothetical protein